MDVNQEILDLAIKPISESESCGVNAKYEPDYEALEFEISKSQSLNSDSTDWDQVAKYCKNILSNISKDYPTACYYAYSLTLKSGYSGMLDGFSLIEKMSEQYWDNLFPPVKRLRARQNSTQWLIEKIAAYLESNEPKESDFIFIGDIASTVKNLDFLLADKMSESAPNFADINRPLKRLKEIAKAQAKVEPPKAAVEPAIAQPNPVAEEAPAQETTMPEEPAQAVAQAQVQASPQPVATKPTVKTAEASPKKSSSSPITTEVVGDIQTEQDAKKAFKQAQDILKKLSGYHAQVKASDPKRYRYSRMALWGSLDKLPPAKDSKTQLPAPPADKLKKVIELYEANEFLECIELAEKSADKMPYWFDGNRYIVLSLEALGAEYDKAKYALELELREFIKRVPKIIDLQYSNGEPFVSDACKNWLHSLNETNTGSASTASSDLLAPVIDDAKKLALSGKLAEAFDLLNEAPAKTKRDKFKIKMACAELACLNGQVRVGIPMLERLVEEVRVLTVADWESDFLSKALALLVNAYEKLDETELAQKQQKKEAAYDQLCWYNPALISQ
ncbi:MAG: type VI secretion system protein TssA [Bermanella sp.]